MAQLAFAPPPSRQYKIPLLLENFVFVFVYYCFLFVCLFSVSPEKYIVLDFDNWRPPPTTTLNVRVTLRVLSITRLLLQCTPSLPTQLLQLSIATAVTVSRLSKAYISCKGIRMYMCVYPSFVLQNLKNTVSYFSTKVIF